MNTDLIIDHVEIEVQVDLLSFFFEFFISAFEDLDVFRVKRVDLFLYIVHFVVLRRGVSARVSGLTAVRFLGRTIYSFRFNDAAVNSFLYFRLGYRRVDLHRNDFVVIALFMFQVIVICFDVVWSGYFWRQFLFRRGHADDSSDVFAIMGSFKVDVEDIIVHIALIIRSLAAVGPSAVSSTVNTFHDTPHFILSTQGIFLDRRVFRRQNWRGFFVTLCEQRVS